MSPRPSPAWPSGRGPHSADTATTNRLRLVLIGAPGLEEAIAAELRAFGGSPGPRGPGQVRCLADAALAARLVLGARTVSRVVWELAEGLPAEPRALVRGVADLPWDEIVGDRPFAVRASGRSPRLRHSGFTCRVVKDGVVDRCRARGLPRPRVDLDHPAVLIDARVHGSGVRIGIDLGRRSLHLRGTGRRGPAPLREDIAAGLALLAGAAARRVVVDPFCGTGTLLAEAAAIALGRPAGRVPASTGLGELAPFADLDLRALGERPLPVPDRPVLLLGADADAGAVRVARAALAHQGLAGHVRIAQRPIDRLELPAGLPPGLVLTNPPWGRRLATTTAEAAWRELGAFARRLPGWTLAVLSGDPELTRGLRLKATRHWDVAVGGVSARLLLYDIAS